MSIIVIFKSPVGRGTRSSSGFGSYNDICLDLPNEYPGGSRKMSIIVTFKSPDERSFEDSMIIFRGELLSFNNANMMDS